MNSSLFHRITKVIFFPLLQLKHTFKCKARHSVSDSYQQPFCFIRGSVMQRETKGRSANRSQDWPQAFQHRLQKAHHLELRTIAFGWRLLEIRCQEWNMHITRALNYHSCFQISFSHSKQQSHLYILTKKQTLAVKVAEVIWIHLDKNSPSSSDLRCTCKSTRLIQECE